MAKIRSICVLFTTAFLWSGQVFAEGTAELTTIHRTWADTVIYVDILDYTIETFTWRDLGGGTGVDVWDPDGVSLGRLNDNATLNPTKNGAYEVHLRADEPNWDLTVNNAIATGGRIWSYNWHLNANGFTQSRE
ncbi:MAG: hypothetical protein HN348_18265, partial [Proteobacteria bacterium]|nr:hypothetical protein [Pseudomonadota bacterium]